MTMNTAPLPKRDATRERVAANLYAELKRKRLTTRSTATALGLSQAYVNRRTSGAAEMTASDLELFSEFLNIPITRFFVNDEKGPAGGAARPSLPDLDSNQEPAGSPLPAPIRLADRKRTHTTPIETATLAIVTPIGA